MKIADHLVQDNTDEFDSSILHHPTSLVNMRLFRANDAYRNIILGIVEYIDAHLRCAFDDYTNIKGVAAAALGIPFNIIGYKDQNSLIRVCINPKIVAHSRETTLTRSNCGTLKLNVQAEVTRYNVVDMEFYDLQGNKVLQKGITREMGGFTVQHEVNANLGISIVEKEGR